MYRKIQLRISNFIYKKKTTHTHKNEGKRRDEKVIPSE